MATRKHKPDVRLAISTRRNTYDHLYSVSLHTVVLAARDGKISNPGYFYRDDPDYATNPLQDLCVTALADEEQRWFGWEVSYRETYNVDEERAAAMLKTLRKVRTAMEKAEREFGHPESLGAYAVRVVRALGGTAERPVGLHVGDRAVDGTGYRWMSADGLNSLLADTVSGKVPPTYRN